MTDRATTGTPLIRIESGNPDEEELVALTTVLLARTAGTAIEPPGSGPDSVPVTLWTRPECRAPYRSPTSWQR
ncbi:acyl-CoA carboxylase subunit epsilon [Streptomyces sp. NBC_00078]|uniref:acyl-CoA carboxylase subunit epsilon n=1 Tax=unclassified Streptomyces TaxID=2593676 RepID=UPI002254837D|nr:acyl-CoA carboxylase subunit epsilon [Streptomyces sp. NBC_00078]MCX5418131.1 acyl-CoA carboxylase subunit epsilon [Streptomyces sp. NBC_00078]